MHERRNFILILMVAVSAIWTLLAWVLMGDNIPLLWPQRVFATLLLISTLAWMAYGMWFEDKLPDHMADVVGPLYYGADGVSFLPIIRVNGSQAELSVYYQNRFENPAQVVIHLRPPLNSFVIKPGMQDVHFAFKTGGGDFGVIHQPIAVPAHVQGEVLDVKLGAASYYPRSHGARWRKKPGMPCGTLTVDWGGSAFRIGVHEVSGEIELHNPTTLHLSMPKNVTETLDHVDLFRQEQIAAGNEA